MTRAPLTAAYAGPAEACAASAASAAATAAGRDGSIRLERALLLATMLAASLVVWIAPRPPLVDLPQHAAQVAQLRDLLLGDSPWGELLRINVLTPYLIGYGLALPFALVASAGTALKIVLTLAYLAHVAMCVKLRRTFSVDRRLDWLAVPGFLGFAWSWGFLTYLVAAPAGLLFLLLAWRHAGRPTPARAAGLAAAGVLLFFCHGLVFGFCAALGAAWLVCRCGPRAALRAALPYVALFVLAAAYVVLVRQGEAPLPRPYEYASEPLTWRWGWSRVPEFFAYPLGAVAGPRFIALSAVMMAVPWLLGLRVRLGRGGCHALPFAMLLLVWLAVPSYAANTAFLYERFALFMLPFYALLFAPPPAEGDREAEPPLAMRDRRPAGMAVRRRLAPWAPMRACRLAGMAARQRLAPWALALLPLACWAFVAGLAGRQLRFAHEAADWDRIAAAVRPGERGLSLVFAPASRASSNPAYVHFPAWYAANQHGLVDFSFAYVRQPMVRYRVGHFPPIAPGFEWTPGKFDWRERQGRNYRYFFVRHTAAVPAGLFDGAACAPRLLAASGAWSVYENQACR